MSGFVRPLEGWQLLGDPAAGAVLRFTRRWYREPGDRPALARAEVEASAVGTPMRRALAAFVLLGTVSPTDAAAIAAEAAAASDEGAPRRDPAAESCSTPRLADGELARGFARLHPQLPGALDDPMRGVLASPLHESLFASGCGLLAAFERLRSLRSIGVDDPLLAYTRCYLRCRQTILHLALVLARSLPALAPTSAGPDADFFAWWRERWTQRTTTVLERAGSVSIGFPEELPAGKAAAITGALARLAREHEWLAARLGSARARRVTSSMRSPRSCSMARRTCCSTAGTEHAARGRSRSRSSSSAGTATRPERKSRRGSVSTERRSKTVSAASSQSPRRLRLPRCGREITVRRLGNCPFPDYGFVAARSEPR